MTPVEDLIEGASGDGVPVATLLRKVKVVAARLKTVELEQWVDHELNGYPDAAELPDYRAARRVEVKGHFAGPGGTSLRNAVIAPVSFPAEYRDGPLFHVSFSQPISELERLAAAKTALTADWSGDAVVFTNHLVNKGEVQLYEYMGLQQAFRMLSPAMIQAIVDTVRTRILDLALALEEVAPEAGVARTEAPDYKKVQQIVMNVTGGSQSIAIASSDFSQESTSLPPVGDREALLSVLDGLGFSVEERAELEQALELDAADSEGAPGIGIGPRVKSWAGELALKGGAAAGKGAAGAGGAFALKALAAYFGIG